MVIINHNIYRVLNRCSATRHPPQQLKDRRNVSLKESRKTLGAKRNAKDKRRESAELLPRERSTEPSDERLLALPAAAGDPQSVQVRVAVLQTAAVPCTANA